MCVGVVTMRCSLRRGSPEYHLTENGETDMATLTELMASRASAGARYAAAVTELQEAFIDLAAHDQEVSRMGGNNSVVGAFNINSTELRTPQNMLWHSEFAPDAFKGIADAIGPRVEQISR